MRPIRRMGVGLVLAISVTIPQIFCLAVSITPSMLPERSMQKTTSTRDFESSFAHAGASGIASRATMIRLFIKFLLLQFHSIPVVPMLEGDVVPEGEDGRRVRILADELEVLVAPEAERLYLLSGERCLGPAALSVVERPIA